MWQPDTRDARPIWKQIEDRVRFLIASGTLPAGAAVPSVRRNARELAVNPATVAKAYQRLAEAGLLTVRRGEGTFVCELPEQTATGLSNEQLEEAAAAFVRQAALLGATEQQARKATTRSWRRFLEPLGETDDE